MASRNLGRALESTHTARSATGAVTATASAGHQVALALTPEAMRMHPEDLAREILRTQSVAQAAARAALRKVIGDGASTPATPVDEPDEESTRPDSWLV